MSNRPDPEPIDPETAGWWGRLFNALLPFPGLPTRSRVAFVLTAPGRWFMILVTRPLGQRFIMQFGSPAMLRGIVNEHRDGILAGVKARSLEGVILDLVEGMTRNSDGSFVIPDKAIDRLVFVHTIISLEHRQRELANGAPTPENKESEAPVGKADSGFNNEPPQRQKKG